MMQAHDVLEVINQLENVDVSVWLDGGWGVDALVGTQTREHSDIDVVIPLEQVPLALQALQAIGYAINEDELPTRFVMRDAHGRSIDFHTVIFDHEGDGIQQLQDGRLFHYPSHGFTGTGQIENQTMHCLTAEVQVLCHLGYEPDENDYHDMFLLEKHFKIRLPAPYSSVQ